MNVSRTAGNFEKEKSVKKNIKIFLILCVIAVLCGCGYLFARYQHTSPKRLPDRYGAKIPQVHSSVDKDNDGIDDQTDILQGALDYVASRPKYKSKYYRTGYPNDGYGVCTDVVAFALKNAGYDLKHRPRIPPAQMEHTASHLPAPPRNKAPTSEHIGRHKPSERPAWQRRCGKLLRSLVQTG